MADLPSLILGSLKLVSVVVFLYLADVLWQRTVSSAARLAQRQWVLFWVGLAAVDLISAVESLYASFALPPFDVVVTAGYVEVLILTALLWGLVGYLIYLFRGKYYLTALSVLYGIYYVILLYAEVGLDPTGVALVNGQVTLTGESSLSLTFLIIIVVGLLVPEIVGSILYFVLLFRTEDRAVRYRIGVVSLSILGLFTIGVFAPSIVPGLAGQVLGGLLTLVFTLLILMAYRPPEFIRAKLGGGGENRYVSSPAKDTGI